jgi:hypothetical protein
MEAREPKKIERENQKNTQLPYGDKEAIVTVTF